ncbi:MAG: right-handed parallel beta-helix repeat-containing protein [Candidatus Bathyarchaeales archaeon]
MNGQKAKLVVAAILAVCLAFALAAVSYYFPPYPESAFQTTPQFMVYTPISLPPIYIRDDGTVDPPVDALQQTGNAYTFTGNIVNHTLVVQRDNIVINGTGHALIGYAQNNIAKGTVGIVICCRRNVTITDLNVERYVFSINITSSSDIFIKNNKLDSQWLLIDSSTNNTIIENTIIGGIQITKSANNIFAKNKITNAIDGIFLCGSSFNTVKENILENCDCAILIQGTYENVLNNQVINGRVGIAVEGSHNKIFQNDIRENSEAGISVNLGNNNILYENIIENNKYGVIIGFTYNLNAENNTFYYNDFLNNAQNVLIRIGNFTNFWDNGKDGNYWSDYKGVDSNNDGIGDAPYIISESNQDRYPLIAPRENQKPQSNQLFWIYLGINLTAIFGVIACILYIGIVRYAKHRSNSAKIIKEQ